MTGEELEILVKDAQQGDRYAVERLILAHKQAVFGLALTFLKDRQSAEEAAQESFIRIFQRLRTLRKPRGFRSWCLTITANYCRDQLRSKRPQTVSLELAPEPVAEPSKAASEHIKQGLQNLSAPLRQALILKDVESFSYQEIAEIQNTALGTVKSRIFEARRKLREWMNSCSVKK